MTPTMDKTMASPWTLWSPQVYTGFPPLGDDDSDDDARYRTAQAGALIPRLGLVDPLGGPTLNRRGAPWVGNDPKSPKLGALIRRPGLGIDPKRHEEFVALGRKWP